MQIFLPVYMILITRYVLSAILLCSIFFYSTSFSGADDYGSQSYIRLLELVRKIYVSRNICSQSLTVKYTTLQEYSHRKTPIHSTHIRTCSHTQAHKKNTYTIYTQAYIIGIDQISSATFCTALQYFLQNNCYFFFTNFYQNIWHSLSKNVSQLGAADTVTNKFLRIVYS